MPTGRRDAPWHHRSDRPGDPYHQPIVTSTKKVTAAMLCILNRKLRIAAPTLGATVILALTTAACTSSGSEPKSGASSPPVSSPALSTPSPSTTLSDTQLRKQAEAALPKGKAAMQGGAPTKDGVTRRKARKLRGDKRYVLEIACAGAGTTVMHYKSESTGASGDSDINCDRRPNSFGFTDADALSFEVDPSHADGFIAWQIVQRDYKGS